MVITHSRNEVVKGVGLSNKRSIRRNLSKNGVFCLNYTVTNENTQVPCRLRLVVKFM